jgi:type IX secretion system PorP/SprF family membrane protein
MRSFLVVFLIFSSLFVYSQDVGFSQFYNNRQYLNSAYAGAEGGFRFNSAYRNQWSNLPTGFTTNIVGGDCRIEKKQAGVGGFVMHDRAGVNVLNTTSVYLNLQKNIKLYDEFDHRLDLHMGIQTGFVTKRLNWNNLVFTDQLDPVTGVSYPSGATPPETMAKNYPDFGTGALLRFRGPDVHHDFGFTVSHLSRPNQSFYGVDDRLPMRFSVHYIGMAPIRRFFGRDEKDFTVAPVAIAEKQGYFEQINTGAIFQKDYLYGGVSYRFKRFNLLGEKANSAILTVGARKIYDENYILRFYYSYDITLSGVRSGASGAHEICLSFEYDPSKNGKRAAQRKVMNYR